MANAYRVSQDTWSQLIEILTDVNRPERKWVSQALVELLITAFQHLRMELEKPNSRTTWNVPYLSFRFDFPCESEDGRCVVAKGEDEGFLDNLEGLVEVMTAGTSVAQLPDGSRIPAVSQAVLRHLLGASKTERKRLSERWIDREEWMRFRDQVDLEVPVDESIVGRGSAGQFIADIFFSIGKLTIDPEKRETYFLLRVGLPFSVTSPNLHPDSWSQSERSTLWAVVDQFLDGLKHRLEGQKLARSFQVEVPREGARLGGIEAFDAKYSGRRKVDFLAKLSPPTLERSPLRRIPKYALGTRGPVLDMFDRKGKIIPFAYDRMIGVMVHPQNPPLRDQLVAKLQSQAALEAIDIWIKKYDVKVPIEFLWPKIHKVLNQAFGVFSLASQRALLDSPSLKTVNSRLETAFFIGSTVGDMLSVQLACAIHHPQHLGVNKAAHLKSVDLKDSRPHQRRVSTEIPKIKRWWSEFRSVAHFWAAFQLWNLDLDQDPGFSPFHSESLPNFLAAAEWFRQMGEQCFSKGQRSRQGPLLDPTKTWWVPGSGMIEIHPNPLSPEALEALSQYRAP